MATKAAEQEVKDTVTIKLPLTRDERDDVWVGINGDSWLLQRGVAVEVPRCVYEVLERREENLRKAYEYEEELSKRSQ